MYLQLYVVRNYNSETISVKEMEPNFVRMIVPEWPELKKYLQSVSRISVAKKTFGFVCKSPRACQYQSLLLFRRLLNQLGPRHQGTRADSKEYWLLQEQNILPSSVLTSCFFSGSKYFPGVSFHCLRAFDVSPRLLGMSTTLRRFSPMMFSECKYWGNRIQFSRAKTSFEIYWTYSGVPRTEH